MDKAKDIQSVVVSSVWSVPHSAGGLVHLGAAIKYLDINFVREVIGSVMINGQGGGGGGGGASDRDLGTGVLNVGRDGLLRCED